MMPIAPLVNDAAIRVVDSVRVVPTLRGAFAVVGSIGAFGAIAAAGMALTPTWFESVARYTPGQAPSIGMVARVFVVPSLVEEMLWRVILQPPTMHWGTCVLVNAVFAFPYHWTVGAIAGGEAARTFRHPVFGGMAFLLGNLCSFSYRNASFGAWAPVVVHGILVSIWLTTFDGEAILLGEENGD